MPLEVKFYGYYDVDGQLPVYMRDKARELFARNEAAKDAVRTAADFRRYQKNIRAQFLDAIGGLPDERAPLNVRETGVNRYDGYSVRKLIYESLPKYYVTANLYVPEGLSAPAPAILFLSGHDEQAKASPLYQIACRDLARGGFVVLAIDPMSQGERLQAYNRETGRPAMFWPAEHSVYAAACDWAGGSLIRYFVWDMIRAMDLLSELPEVDPNRIGATGNSGGGMQTAYLMMTDERLTAAMPCTFLTSAREYMKTGQPQDGEQIVPGAFKRGIDHDDYLSCFAPRAACLGAVESDFFCVEGVLDSFERAQRMYAAAGAPGMIELALVPGTHDYNAALRQHAVRFFKRALMGVDDGFVTDENQEPVPVKELNATASGQVMAEFPDARTIQQINCDYYLKNRLPAPESLEEARERLAAVLHVPEKTDAPIRMRWIRTQNDGRKTDNFGVSCIWRSGFFLSEPEIAVGGIHIAPEGGGNRRCALIVLEGGAESVHEDMYRLRGFLSEGMDVYAFDPRSHGTTRCRDLSVRSYYEMHGTENKMQADSILIGESLMGMRVFDILRAVEYLSPFYPDGIRLAGTGIGALWITLTAPFVKNLHSLHIENPPPPFADMIAAPVYRFDARLNQPGLPKQLDTTDIYALLNARGIPVRRIDMPDVGPVTHW